MHQQKDSSYQSETTTFENNEIDVPQNNEVVKFIEIRCRASRKYFGLIDHYFYVINGSEYHVGNYKKGKILPINTTKGYHVVSKTSLCDTCHDKIIENYKTKEDNRLFKYYPFINCESLTTGISLQSLLIFGTLPILFISLFKGKFLISILIIFILLTALLMYSKFIYSRTRIDQCSHLKI